MKIQSMKKISFLLWAFVLTFSGCQQEGAPKPYGYFRIETPEPVHQKTTFDCPFEFQINSAAIWQPHKENSCWGDVYYPSIKARLQLTYKSFSNSTERDLLLKEAQDLAFKHTVVADGIRERSFENTAHNVYGISYQMLGNAASNTQFYLTDSSQHFIRGALYFYSPPNADSLRPVNQYMMEEIAHLIETFRWKE